MKKKIIAMLATCALALSLTACGESANTFTVGFDAEFPPYGYMDDNGEYVGLQEK